METGTPGLKRVITMSLFALSCAGLLLFLWLSFGGTLPFNPQGYRVNVAFPYADQLGAQADVRIAGVTIGKVVDKAIDIKGNRTLATIQMSRKFAPIHRDAHAILRIKTIVGETYVELTPGTPNSPILPDGGTLPRGQTVPAVQLDQVDSTFNPPTRHAFQDWQQQLSQAVRGNDQNLSNVLGNLPPFAADASDILQVLDVQHSALTRLFQNGSTVFAALNQNQSALRNLITSGEATFRTTAANNNALADTFHVLPMFLNETKVTLAQLKVFSLNTDPLIKELDPVAMQLGPTLHSVRVLAPYLRNLFVKLGPLITVARTGLPAVRMVLDGARPLLASVGPFLEQLNPIIDWLSIHQQLITDFISAGASGLAGTINTTSYGRGNGITCQGVPCGHYLRQFNPLSAPGFSPTRDVNTRGNNYPPPLWLADTRDFSAGGKFPGSFSLPAWDCDNTGGPRPASATVQACWVDHPPGSIGRQIPHIVASRYSSK